jgi:hypothetical protein
MNYVSSAEPRNRCCRILCLAAFALICTTAVIGCKSTSYTETTIQGVKVRIIHPNVPSKFEHDGSGPPPGGKRYDKEVCSWAGDKPGRVEVVIEDLRLQVDGGDFGTVKPNDSVIIDATKGVIVMVNDQQRQAVGKN